MHSEFHRAKFQSDRDDSVVRCPYCKSDYQPEAEDYSEDTREDECPECGKKYWLNQVFTVDHCVKPDCELNGEEHQWDTVSERHSQWESCAICDKWRAKPASPQSESE